MFMVRGPELMKVGAVRSKVTCPLPFGPPRASYGGRVPIPALARVETDANEGFDVIIETNLEQAVVEYGPMKLPPL